MQLTPYFETSTVRSDSAKAKRLRSIGSGELNSFPKSNSSRTSETSPEGPLALGAFTGITSRCTDPQLLAFPSVNQKGEAEFGLEMLYTEAVAADFSSIRVMALLNGKG